MINLTIMLIVLLMSSSAFSAGFRLSEQSARANGIGNSFTAVADDASAVWYNPAAITDMEKTQISLGSVMIAPEMEHKNTNGTTDKIAKRLHVPPQIYATHRLNEKISLGFGINAPFGLQTNWGTGSNTKSIATLSDIKAFNYNLNTAYKVNDKLSLAAGADYMTIDAKLNKMIGTKEFELEGDGNGWGYNLAAFYKLNEKWNLGANYRSQVKIDVDGTAKYFTSDNSASTKLTLPDTFQLGAAYKASEKWLFSLTADYTNWATYHKLNIKSKTILDITTTFVPPLPDTDTSIDTKKWKSVWAYRLGTEYKYSENLKLRGGLFYDFNPVREKYFESRVPDTDRLAFSIGAGYTKGNMVFDFSYTYLKFMERKIDSTLQDDSLGNVLNGKYNAFAHLPAFSVGYKF